MKISIIQPSRNNLKYLKWSYNSIRKNQGNHTVQICVADDFSDDGTLEWLQEQSKVDKNLNFIRNEGPTRLGHTILYDRLINEVAKFDICMIYHADMYLCPGALDEIDNNLAMGPGNIVSLTRIEPPLHPPGPEKILENFGVEPENFDEEGLLEFHKQLVEKNKDKILTEGVFAPWAFYKKDFQEIGGHDPLYAPQSKEDSDIFNRFMLKGIIFMQTWQGYVYHMTCRGSRFNPKLTTPGTNSREWNEQNVRSTRNFIRKWGSMVKHSKYLKPIVPPKYNIAFVVNNCDFNILSILEPWCDRIYTDILSELRKTYIQQTQPETKFDLTKRVLSINLNNPNLENDIIVYLDAHKFTQQDFNYIQQLPEIIKDSGEKGAKFKLGNLTIEINQMVEYQNDLIYV